MGVRGVRGVEVGRWTMDREIKSGWVVETCVKCGGSGFSGYGTGYDDVCPDCGGTGYNPVHKLDREQEDLVNGLNLQQIQRLDRATWLRIKHQVQASQFGLWAGIAQLMGQEGE